MKIRSLLILSLTLAAMRCAPTLAVEPTSDWPFWRGPQHNGIASAEQSPPLKWNKTENVLWSVDIPGRGHSSPVVVGEQVFVATADLAAQQQTVHCYDRETGKQRWVSVVHQGGLVKEGNKKATLASSTVACVGDRVFINFLNRGAVTTSALSRGDGSILWQTEISKYKVHQGYGASPIPFRDLVLVAADNKGEAGGAVAALEQATGKIRWRHSRPSKPNYPSPALLTLDGKPRMIMTGCDLVTALDPASGDKLWEFDGATTECVTTAVTDGKRIFTSGGYPKNHVSAMLADGSGKVVWENKTRVYVPSMLVRDGHLYAVADQGFAICWDSQTGEQKWKNRLPGGGDFTSSPVMVGELIYATSERGLTTVFRATPEEFKVLSQNQLGDRVYATPAICDGRIYAKVVVEDGKKLSERLYCLGAGKTNR